jgi:hypothetical protein
MLAAAAIIYGTEFSPLLSLKALPTTMIRRWPSFRQMYVGT